MSIHSTKYVPKGQMYAHGHKTTPDIKFGGQNGWAPNINEWANTTPAVRNDLVVHVMRPPRMFELFDNTKEWIRSFRAMIETHADSITGFNATLNVNLAEKNIGASEEKYQRHTKVTKARTELNMTYTDLEGEPFRRMHDIWIKYGIRDPDTQYPLASTLKERPEEWGPEWYTCDIIAFEPDYLFRSVRNAWFLTNVAPTTSGEIVGSKNLSEDKGLLEMSIPYTSWGVSNQGVIRMAEKRLEKINLTYADSLNYDAMYPDGKGDVNAYPDVKDPKESGWMRGVERIRTARPAGNKGNIVNG